MEECQGQVGGMEDRDLQVGILDPVVVGGAQDSQAHRVGKPDSPGEGLEEVLGEEDRSLEERLD